MIISGGENIFPSEVESVYANFPGLSKIAVVGEDDSDWGQTPVAFVVSEQPLSESELISFGRQKLAHYEVPKAFYRVKELPVNASGKIKRYQLRIKLKNKER